MVSANVAVPELDVEAFARDGFLIVRGLVSETEAAQIRDTFMSAAANGPVEGLSEFKHKGTAAYDKTDPLSYYPRMMNPHRHPEMQVGKTAMQYMLSPRIGAALEQLMGEPAVAVQTMFYFKPPGARGQDFHQDNFYLKVKPGTCMAAWIAIDHCDAENGGMMCVPDTQTYDVQCPEQSDSKLYFTTEHVAIPEGKTAVLPIMKPGDVLFFNGQTIHGSGPNTSTDRFRRSLICHYVPQSTAEMSHWYKPIDFTGKPLTHIGVNNDGGPCGTLQEAAAPH